MTGYTCSLPKGEWQVQSAKREKKGLTFLYLSLVKTRPCAASVEWKLSLNLSLLPLWLKTLGVLKAPWRKEEICSPWTLQVSGRCANSNFECIDKIVFKFIVCNFQGRKLDIYSRKICGEKKPHKMQKMHFSVCSLTDEVYVYTNLPHSQHKCNNNTVGIATWVVEKFWRSAKADMFFSWKRVILKIFSWKI